MPANIKVQRGICNFPWVVHIAMYVCHVWCACTALRGHGKEAASAKEKKRKKIHHQGLCNDATMQRCNDANSVMNKQRMNQAANTVVWPSCPSGIQVAV